MHTSEHINGRESLENTIWLAVAACLDLDPDAPETHERIRISWPVDSTGGSNPGWRRDDNVCFIRLAEDTSDPFGRLRDVGWEYDQERDDVTETVEYTRVHTLYLIFYGPRSFDDAERARVMLFREGPRRILRARRLYPMPHNRRVTRAPELDEGVWWDRSDVEITIYEGVRLESKLDYFNEARANAAFAP